MGNQQPSISDPIDFLARLFGDKFGRVYKNNSRASEKNKVWIMTKQAAQTVLTAASGWKVLSRKFPS